jgi:hypothetical protein
MCVGPIIDTVGGKVRERWFGVLSPTGILVSVGSLPSEEMTRRLYGPSMVFFLVEVTTDRLDTADYSITGNGRAVGTMLPVDEARVARQMLGGAPHNR